MILLHGGLPIGVLVLILIFYLLVSIGCFVILLAMLRLNRSFAGFLERCKEYSAARYWGMLVLLYIAATAVVFGVIWLRA